MDELVFFIFGNHLNVKLMVLGNFPRMKWFISVFSGSVDISQIWYLGLSGLWTHFLGKVYSRKKIACTKIQHATESISVISYI